MMNTLIIETFTIINISKQVNYSSECLFALPNSTRFLFY